MKIKLLMPFPYTGMDYMDCDTEIDVYSINDDLDIVTVLGVALIAAGARHSDFSPYYEYALAVGEHCTIVEEN